MDRNKAGFQRSLLCYPREAPKTLQFLQTGPVYGYHPSWAIAHLVLPRCPGLQLPNMLLALSPFCTACKLSFLYRETAFAQLGPGLTQHPGPANWPNFEEWQELFAPEHKVVPTTMWYKNNRNGIFGSFTTVPGLCCLQNWISYH